MTTSLPINNNVSSNHGTFDESHSRGVNSTLKVPVERVDAIMDLCGELVVIKSQLEHHPLIAKNLGETDLDQVLSLLGNTIRDVYQHAMSMRLVSIKPTLLKLERAVDDASVRLGKSVSFEVHGYDLELDRSMIEQISDPLMHLCRNAVDHGIETPEARRQKGKKSEGRIKLDVWQEGAKAVIEINDDGAGINTDKVLEKAQRLGLVNPQQSSTHLAPSEIYEFLFKPGFSTTDHVGEISGRGIGLDVVRSTIRHLRGDVTVSSEANKGTSFKLTIPITSALTDCILTSVNNQLFLFPVTLVSEFISLNQVTIESSDQQHFFFRHREQFFPLRWFRDVFGIEHSKTDGVILMLKTEIGLMGLTVESVVGQYQVVIKKVDDSYHGNSYVAGAAILGDGKVALVIDPTMITVSTKRVSLPTLSNSDILAFEIDGKAKTSQRTGV